MKALQQRISRPRGPLCAWVFGMAALLVGTAHAAIITVNEAIDDDPATDNGSCSLREAVIAANTNTAVDSCLAGEVPPDTISFDASLNGTPLTLSISGTGEDAAMTGDLDLTANVNLVGNGESQTVIDAGGIDRVIHAMARTGILDVTIQGGFSGTGGGVLATDAVVVLIDCVVRNNEVDGGGGLLDIGGGGVAVLGGELRLQRCVVKDNAARGSSVGGGVLVSELAAPIGAFVIEDTRIIGNRVENSSGGAGGGGVAVSVPSLPSVEIARTEISGNSVTAEGGEARGGGLLLDDGRYELRNTTISGNSVAGDVRAAGGGVYVNPTFGGGIVPDRFIHNSTITDNRADGSMGGVAFGGGLAVGSGALTVLVSNTIVAGNDAGGSADDCSGELASLGYVLLGSNAGCGFGPTPGASGMGDQVGDVAGGGEPIDPMLAPLADNGGPTRTHAPIEGSPAIDAGNPNPVMAAMPPVCESGDQRGESRPADDDGDGGAVCDIGAFEGSVAAASSGNGGGGGTLGPLLLACMAWLATACLWGVAHRHGICESRNRR